LANKNIYNKLRYNNIGIQADMLAIRDLSKLYKGAVIPHLITQELISLSTINDKKTELLGAGQEAGICRG
jgi:hypothetical protein